MVLKQAGWAVIALVAVQALVVGPAYSQQNPARGTTVTDRPRPETDPLGLRTGSFLVFPSVALTEEIRDNIFFDERDKQGDFISIISPKILIQSDWSNHALNLFGDADVGGYAINGDENYQDYHFGIDGRVDITRDTNFSARFDFANRHESRGSPDDVNGKTPIDYNLYGPTVQFYHRLNRVSITIDGNLREFNFKDVTTGVNEALGILAEGEINNDDRDRREAEIGGRIAYEIVPGYEAFVRGAFNDRDYTFAVDDNGFNRDSHGWEAVAGTAVDLTGVVVGNVFVGYRKQIDADPQFSGIKGLGFGGDLTWNPSGLTTVKGSLSRTVEETTLAGAAGFFATRGAISVDHEVLRNLIVSVTGSYQMNDYEGNTREDEIARAGGQVKYLMNRNFYVTIGYNFQNRESSFLNQDYTVNTFVVRLEGQL